MRAGIYIIRNSVNGKVYVGASLYLKKRWRQHRNDLRAGRHNNRHLQSDWTTYGESAFEFTVAIHVDGLALLRMHEDDWITRLKAADPIYGYNIQPNSRSVGYIPSEAMRQKVSAALKGKPKSAQMRARLSKAQKGRVFSAETRAKMSAARKTPEAQARISELNKARNWTPEKRAQVAEKIRRINAQRTRDQHGRILPDTDDQRLLEKAAARPRMSKGFSGREHTTESREKMSAVQKRNVQCRERDELGRLVAVEEK